MFGTVYPHGGASPEIAALQEPGADLSSYLEALNRIAIVATTDPAGRIDTVNDRFCEISKYARDELVGSNHRILNSGYHSRSFFKEMWKTIGAGGAWHGEIRNRAKDGTFYWVDTTIVPRRNGAGRRTGYVSIRYDITNRKVAEAALREENLKRERAEELLREILNSLPGAVAAYDPSGRLVLFNESFELLYGGAPTSGMSAEEVLLSKIASGALQVSQDDPARAIDTIRKRLSRSGMHVQRMAGGRWFQVEERRSQRGYRVTVETDVSEIKRTERQARRDAERDPLTGLFNRRVLLDRLGKLTSEPEPRHALFLIDLDRFKEVNDTLGHDAGDMLLVEAASRLQDTLRKSDLLARLGGDEFAVVARQVETEQDAEAISRKLLDALQQPLRVRGKTIIPGASIGFVMIFDRERAAAEWMRRADLALYAAKSRGRATFAGYRSAMSRQVEMDVSRERDLASALQSGSIDIALQPQVRMDNGDHSGFETLLRWKRRGRVVPPPEAVAAAGRAGLGCKLALAVAQQSLESARELTRHGLAVGTVGINVAAPELQDTAFLPALCRMIDRAGLGRHSVELEVTEQVVLDSDGDRVRRCLEDCSREGLRVALDDFGTGYASLSHLTKLPIDRLKIDRTFVLRAVKDNASRAVVRTIIELAHDLGMTVVAEGIEAMEHFNLLRDQGCDFAQGYLIGRPLPVGELRATYPGRFDPPASSPSSFGPIEG